MSNKEDTVYIEDYSDKSFVVRGDTRPHRESLKLLGGKWVNRLTDKTTGEKFGGWIFWTEKRKELDNWVKGGFKALNPKQGTAISDDSRLKRIEAQLKRIEALLTELVTGEVIDGEEETPRRLLGTK